MCHLRFIQALVAIRIFNVWQALVIVLTASLFPQSASSAVLSTQTVVVSQTLLAGQYTEMYAACPVGYVAVSGSVDTSLVSGSNWSAAHITTLAPTAGKTPLFLFPDGVSSLRPDGWYAGLIAPKIISDEGPTRAKFAVTCAQLDTVVSMAVASSTALLSTPRNSLEARCPSGSLPLGGGFDVDGSDNLDFFRVAVNRPLAVGDAAPEQQTLLGWTADIVGANIAFLVAPPAKVLQRAFKVGAICAAASGVRLVSRSAYNANYSDVSCPVNWLPLSGGAYSTVTQPAHWGASSINRSDDGISRLVSVADGSYSKFGKGWYVTLLAAQTSDRIVSLWGLCVQSTATANTRIMTEFRYAPLDYYFITSRPSEIAALDALSGWARTGKTFNVAVAATLGLLPITRFYFDRVARGATRGSHFYTLLSSEVAVLHALNPSNASVPGKPVDEGIDSYASTPLNGFAGQVCPVGTVAVYRLFRGNVRFPDDPNHRYTTELSIYNDFVSRGWDGEGIGLCALP